LPSLYPHQDRFETIFDEFQVGLNQRTYCERNHRSQLLVPEILSLDIINNQNIQQCLSEYFRPVNLMKCICSASGLNHNQGNANCNPYRCEQCDMYVAATKTTSINYLPNVLVLHLKRFRYEQSTGQVNQFSILLIFLYFV